jgi:TetR/AcrR family transcriptional regulator, transcriptional repressor for nem operon
MTRGTETRERILDAAQHLVLRQGFASTTVDAVLAEARSSKGAFFHHFPSKADLGKALVERYAAADAAALDELIAIGEAASDDPVDQLLALLSAFEEGIDQLLEVQPGCLFVSFIYEADLAGSETDETVAQSILHWRAGILEKLEKAAAQHPSMPPVELTTLADLLFSIFEGGFLMTRALDDPTMLRRQLAHYRHYVELIFDRPVHP